MSGPNWASSTIWTGDNLEIMRGMNSASVELIYLDPPFNSKADYAAPIGSQAAGAAFKDTWGLDDVNLAWHGEIKHEHPGLYSLLQATRQIHGDSMMSYLIYMAIRVMEMRRLLKPTGSIYLHCDPHASHYLKLLMDSIFGKQNFRNEIVWHYGQRTAFLPRHFSKKHDVILFYAKSTKATLNKVSIKWDKEEFLKHRHDVVGDPDDGAFIWSDGGKTGNRYKRSVKDVLAEGKPLDTVWTLPLLNSSAKERVGYPTQKPLVLLDRIIQASSNPGDVVLDPFCGCATTCIAAQSHGRNWVGIDISTKAFELVHVRLRKELKLFFRVVHRQDIPSRTDLGLVLPYNSRKNKVQLYADQLGYCNGCGEHFEARHLEVDHIIARNKGGTNHISNLQLLCGSCNRVKGTKTQEELLLALTDKGYIIRRRVPAMSGVQHAL